MAELPAAVLAPEAHETGIRRALERALAEVAAGRRNHLVLPAVDLEAILSLLDAMADVDASGWHRGPEGQPYFDGQRVVICCGPPDAGHRCMAAEARYGVRRPRMVADVERQPLVAEYLRTIEPTGSHTMAGSDYLGALLREHGT